jgi:hypothetical protein
VDDREYAGMIDPIQQIHVCRLGNGTISISFMRDGAVTTETRKTAIEASEFVRLLAKNLGPPEGDRRA